MVLVSPGRPLNRSDGYLGRSWTVRSYFNAFFLNTFTLTMSLPSFPTCLVIPEYLQWQKSPILMLPNMNLSTLFPGSHRLKGPVFAVAHTHANVPNSFEQFLLGKGEKKVEMKLDTRTFFFPAYRLQCLADCGQECQTPLFSPSTRKITHWAIFCALDCFKIVGSHSLRTRCVASSC